MTDTISLDPEEVEATLNKLHMAADDLSGTGLSVARPPEFGEVTSEALAPFVSKLSWVADLLAHFTQCAPEFIAVRAIDVRETMRDLEALEAGWCQFVVATTGLVSSCWKISLGV
ncbi:hypothetical protein GCM10022198_17190 [Klugiella xanthotipulae]|uniref:hypothetical protein n=1 Tax=Klugiella xanthotipulae TaxID=244735 RepID=UPI0011518810|nr:hypothetical protein [Klugiella xanthotipulae]